MSDIVDRVAKLVALTASPNEHEAENAAVLACRLIREHGLRVVDGTVARAAFASGRTVHDDLAEIERELAERRAREEALPPYERARTRLSHCHLARREQLELAARECVRCGLNDADGLRLIHELQGSIALQWSEQEIAWVFRAERRAVVAAGVVSP